MNEVHIFIMSIVCQEWDASFTANHNQNGILFLLMAMSFSDDL